MKVDNPSSDDRSGSGVHDHDLETATITPIGHLNWFGGPSTRIGARIGNPLIDTGDSSLSSDEILQKQMEEEANATIKYRTCSWPKIAALLFSEYIVLAIMSFPWSYSQLGLVPGILLTIAQSGATLYTSLTVWEFCLRHPEVRDVCDIGQMLFWGKKWAWYLTAVMFILNNTFIQGLHILVGAEYINTVVGGNTSQVACQTVAFAAIVTVVCWLSSLPRTFNVMANLASASTLFTFISVILATIFAGIEAHPAKFSAEKGAPLITAIPLPSSGFVGGMNAFLNIAYTLIGQITLPSFIAEMKEPRDFPKALWAVTIMQVMVYTIVGSVIYYYTGNQYMTAPAFGSLLSPYKEIAFSFMIPTIIFCGVLYAAVSTRFIFFRIFANSHHKNENTVLGWSVWTAILLTLWVIAFIIANSIPFFSSLLSLMSSLFDSFFGFIFWGLAWFRMRAADGRFALVRPGGLFSTRVVVHNASLRSFIGAVVNFFLILIGLFFLTAGTYATIKEILNEFAAGTVSSAFQCSSNGI